MKTNEKNRSGTSLRIKNPVMRYHVKKRYGTLPVPVVSGELVADVDAFPGKRRDYKKIIGAIFLGVLLLLIFFSKTIYNYNLPQVTATRPQRGTLSKLETSSGIAQWSEVENLYAALDGKVEAVLVKEGDYVTEGQELYRLSFDRDEAERKLREYQNSRSKLKLDIEKLNLNLEKKTREMEAFAENTYEPEEISRYELDLLRIDIRKAQLDLKNTRERYEDGEATELDLDKARYTLDGLYLKQDELERKLEEQEKDVEEAIETNEKEYQSKLLDYESDLASLRLDLEAKNLEFSTLELQEEPYKKALEDYETYAVITAPASGTIVSLDARKGESIRADQLIASVGSAGRFEVSCNVSLENNFILPGDVIDLSNSTHVVTGTVTKITPDVQNKVVTIAFESTDVTAGETFDVTFQKNSVTAYTLIPNGALGQDNDGYFVNLVKRRDGILGEEFYLERLDVYIGDSDSSNTVIVRGITFFEPVALISDKPVSAGETVSLLNESDFFEK